MSSHLKTNVELLNDILKSVHALHKRMDIFQNNLNNFKEDLNITKRNVLDINYRLPERQDGYLWGGSWVKTPNT
jgi:hypothetical protein